MQRPTREISAIPLPHKNVKCAGVTPYLTWMVDTGAAQSLHPLHVIASEAKQSVVARFLKCGLLGYDQFCSGPDRVRILERPAVGLEDLSPLAGRSVVLGCNPGQGLPLAYDVES